MKQSNNLFIEAIATISFNRNNRDNLLIKKDQDIFLIATAETICFD
jgi:hypothetical protein